ncbi:MAG: helix-turn-helix domain-containing protein [Quadrisphaera sp.]
MNPTHGLPEAAEILGVGPQWLATQARQGLVPAHRLGRRWRFTDEDLASILAASATGKAAANPWGLTPRSARRRRAS